MLNSLGFCCFFKSRGCLYPLCSRDWILAALWLGTVQCKFVCELVLHMFVLYVQLLWTSFQLLHKDLSDLFMGSGTEQLGVFIKAT